MLHLFAACPLSDLRQTARSSALLAQSLIEFNQRARHAALSRKYYECPVCCEEKSGVDFAMYGPCFVTCTLCTLTIYSGVCCDFMTCKACFQQHIQTALLSGFPNKIPCVNYECDCFLSMSQIQQVCMILPVSRRGSLIS